MIEATALVKEFSEQVGAPKLPSPPRIAIWTPPSDGWYKVNVDEVVFNELGSCGIGIVIRNDRGEIMGAMSKRMDIPLGALEVEAKAFEEGIQSLKCNVLEWKASNVRRTCDMVAHYMARNAKFVNESVIWVEDIPPIIEFHVNKDVSGLDLGPV